jgi:hypothetical protein
MKHPLAAHQIIGYVARESIVARDGVTPKQRKVMWEASSACLRHGTFATAISSIYSARHLKNKELQEKEMLRACLFLESRNPSILSAPPCLISATHAAALHPKIKEYSITTMELQLITRRWETSKIGHIHRREATIIHCR